jgi:hypothetical protein
VKNNVEPALRVLELEHEVRQLKALLLIKEEHIFMLEEMVRSKGFN